MKRRNIVKFLASLVAILLIIGAVTSWRAYAQLEERIKTIREVGDPVSLGDLARNVANPDDNAATYLVRIADDAEKLYAEIQPFADPDDFQWRTGLSEAQATRVEEGFDAYPQILDALKAASQCERHVWPHDFNLTTNAFMQEYLEPVNDFRRFARVHDCRARYLAAVGEPNEAALVCTRQLRLSRLQGQEPLLVGFLVNIACRSIALYSLNGILQTNELAEKTHQAIEDELAKHDTMENYVHALKTDRAYGIEAMRAMPGPAFFTAGRLSGYLDVMDRHISMGTKSHFQLADSQPVQAKGAHALSVQPALEASREAMNRYRATARCMRILNSICQNAKDADEIDVTALGLPNQATIDPYNGKPLNIKRTENGWIVYSVGNDHKDGGGQLKQQADPGVGPPELMD